MLSRSNADRRACATATESLLLIISLTTSNADIQKLLAFEGAFDKLFAIVRQEGGIGSGGIVVQDCLAAIGGLLRWNVSNQVRRAAQCSLYAVHYGRRQG